MCSVEAQITCQLIREGEEVGQKGVSGAPKGNGMPKNDVKGRAAAGTGTSLSSQSKLDAGLQRVG